MCKYDFEKGLCFVLKFYFLSANERSVCSFAGYFCTMSIKMKLKIQGAKLYQNINDEGKTVSHPKNSIQASSAFCNKKYKYDTTSFYFISR